MTPDLYINLEMIVVMLGIVLVFGGLGTFLIRRALSRETEISRYEKEQENKHHA